MCSRSRGFFERGKTEIKGPLYEEGGFFAYVAVFAQFVQLSLAGMQASFRLGKKASIGNSIWPKTSQGDSVLELPTFLHVFDGMQ